MIEISSFGYGKAINDLFIGLQNGIVSDGSHRAKLDGNWIINIAKFDKNQYYITVGIITGFDTRSASNVWPEWAKNTVTYSTEFVSPVMYCPLITDSMMAMGNLTNQYRQQILDWAFTQI